MSNTLQSSVERAANLRQQWAELRAANPRLRSRNAAVELGVSEGELLASECGRTATRLRNEPGDILKRVKSLGRVMALTRNDHAVHERKGVYDPVEIGPHASLVTGKDIDLRIFLTNWKSAFAVVETDAKGETKRSLQFFDGAGNAVHKIHLLADSDVAAFDGIVADFISEEQSGVLETVPAKPAAAEIPDSAVDRDAFLKDWMALQDTHDFFGMLRKFKVSRTQALRLATEELAERVTLNGHQELLNKAASTGVPIMVFIGNPGCIQIHTGNIHRTVPMENWFNIMDEPFNMHLDESGVHEAWIVRKPTTDGIVTSLELYDAQGTLLVTFFGERKPGKKELAPWRELVEAMPRDTRAARQGKV